MIELAPGSTAQESPAVVDAPPGDSLGTEPDLTGFDAEPVPPPVRSGKKWLLVAAALGLVILAAALAWKYGTAAPPVGFQLAHVERGVIESTVSATGACNAVVDVLVGSQVSGNIKALYADFNTRVKAGQLVALIDPEMFQAKVTQAEAALRNSRAALENARAGVSKAEADVYSAKAMEANQVAAMAKSKVALADAKTKLDRRIRMFGDQILSREDLDTAQAAYDQAVADQQAAAAQIEAAQHNVQSVEAASQAAAKQVAMFQAEVDLNQAALNQARIDLAHTRITAPVDGTVVARRMDVGQTVAASFQAPTIFEIAQDLTKMQVDTNVAESDVGRLEVGQEATFTVDAYPGALFRGRVAQIRKAPINVQNVITYDAVIEVANPDLKLFPGMTANVSVLTERSENALRVPNAALRLKPPESLISGAALLGAVSKPATGWSVVYLPGPDLKAHPVAVKTGITDGNFTQIEQGEVKEGQQVIVGITAPAGAPSPGSPASPAPSMPRRI
jgi:HlyD family secretion protein